MNQVIVSSSSAVKQSSKTLRKINSSGTFVLSLLMSFTVDIIVSKWVALVWRKTDFGQLIWPAGHQRNHVTAFMILHCLEHKFLKGFLVQGWQQSLWKFSIFSIILYLKWWLLNMWKIHSPTARHVYLLRCRGGALSSWVSKMVYKPPGGVYVLLLLTEQEVCMGESWPRS